MNKKDIKKKRMMGYFIDAAKEIVDSEGIQSLSVRKVGDKAGYSYATIYNYFKDLNELLHNCILEYLDDCYKYIVEKLESSFDHGSVINYRDRIELILISYAEYCIKNPNRFQLMFVEDLGEPSEDILERFYKPASGVLLYEEIIKYADKKNLDSKDASTLSDVLSYSIHGKLLMHLKERKNIDKNGLIKSIKRELDFLFSKLE